MISSDFRAEARKKLSGKWGKAVCIALAYIFISFVFGFIQGLFPDSFKSLLSLVYTVIEVPLAFGFIISLLKLFNEEEVKAFDFLKSGFSNFKKAWLVSLNVLLKMLVPIILVVISYVLIAAGGVGLVMSTVTSSSSSGMAILAIVGFILLIFSFVWSVTKGYYYSLANFIAIENPEMTAKEAVLKSEEFMKNNRGKLFCLQFSFIGWAILSAFTFGIGMLWLLPYMQFATISFYKHLTENKTTTEE